MAYVKNTEELLYPINKKRLMRILLVLMSLSHICLSAEFSYTLSDAEVLKLSQAHHTEKLSDKLPSLFKILDLELDCKFDPKTKKLTFAGADKQLKVADYIYLSWSHSKRIEIKKFKTF